MKTVLLARRVLFIAQIRSLLSSASYTLSGRFLFLFSMSFSPLIPGSVSSHPPLSLVLSLARFTLSLSLTKFF